MVKTRRKKAEKDISRQMMGFTEKAEKGKTFQAVADEWAAEHFQNIQHQTVVRYRSYIKRLEEWFDRMYIKDISSKDIMNNLQSMTNQDFSSKTIKDQYNILNMIF